MKVLLSRRRPGVTGRVQSDKAVGVIGRLRYISLSGIATVTGPCQRDL
jgi:hypothetical protein